MIIEGLTVHPSVTAERVTGLVRLAHVSLENPGICLACGADADGCEPDARKYECDLCGEAAVFGAEEVMFHMVV